MAKLLEQEPVVLNVGLKQFCTSLDEQEVRALHVEWRPPAEDDGRIEDLLSALL